MIRIATKKKKKTDDANLMMRRGKDFCFHGRWGDVDDTLIDSARQAGRFTFAVQTVVQIDHVASQHGVVRQCGTGFIQRKKKRKGKVVSKLHFQRVSMAENTSSISKGVRPLVSCLADYPCLSQKADGPSRSARDCAARAAPDHFRLCPKEIPSHLFWNRLERCAPVPPAP